MPLSSTLEDQYALSRLPYFESPGPIPESALKLKSWRYVFEINSACNLRCTLCHGGNRQGYDYHPGLMDMDLMERILDKIQLENPEAIVCCYVNSEPFLHPHIAECVYSIKRRGLYCEFSTNLNQLSQLDLVLAAKPDIFTVSVSGFTQHVYSKAHRGGNIEVVKKNMQEVNESLIRGHHDQIEMRVSYHKYNYNLGEELDNMRIFTEQLGWHFNESWARVISIENTIQALRHIEKINTGRCEPFETPDNFPDMNIMLPPANEDFIKSMETIKFHPAKAIHLYEKWPISSVCAIADVFTEIRWNGKVQLCAWTDDMRLTIGNYLEMTQEEISEKRRGHPLCKECLRYRLPLYFHIVDYDKWDSES